jgi:hypothetical protein
MDATIIFQHIKSDVEQFGFSFYNDTYRNSYRSFLKFFADKTSITEDDFIIAANFTYGWMPTILNFKSSKIQETVDLLNKVKSISHSLTYEELSVVKECINNSLVGASKLLHFIKPDRYAIFDRKVCIYLNKYLKGFSVNKVDSYYKYLELCHNIISKKEYDIIHRRIQNSFSYELSRLRSLELIMFNHNNITTPLPS